VPALAELTDLPSSTASGAGALIGRWQVPLDPLVHLAADGTFAVSLTPSGNDPVMHGAWQPLGGAQAGVQLRSWRGGCAVEPTLVTELTLTSRTDGGLAATWGVRDCQRFEPLHGLEWRDLVRIAPGSGEVGAPWTGDWRPRESHFWIVAFFANGQYEFALPVGHETRILAFGTWSLAGDQLTLHEQAGYCQRRPEDGDGTYVIDRGIGAPRPPTLRLRRRDDPCAMRAPLDGAKTSPWVPPGDHPFHDATFDGQ
jgi:hypothetical protein